MLCHGQDLLPGWNKGAPPIAATVKAAQRVDKMDYTEIKQTKMLYFFHHQSTVSPRNLAAHVSARATVWDMWEAYTSMDPLKAKSVQDVRVFWHAQDTLWRCTSSHCLLYSWHLMLWKGPSPKHACWIPSSTTNHAHC